LALLPAVAVFCLATSGCAPSSTPAASSGGGPLVITEMDYWSTATTRTAVDQLFTLYEKTHPGVVIRRNSVPFAALVPKAVQEAASHTLPDLLVLDNPTVPTFAAAGALVPLDGYVNAQYKPSAFFAGPLSVMKYRGAIYGFPMGNNDLALFYNRDMFAAAHLSPPRTWAELTADAKALTHGDVYGFAFSAKADEEATWQFEPFLWSNGGDLTRVNSPQAVQALQLLTDLVQSGSASRAVVDWGQDEVRTEFMEGRAAMMENGPWNLAMLDKSDVRYGVVSLPAPNAATPPATPLGGEEMTITKSDPRTEAATWALMRWLARPENQLIFSHASGYIPPLKTTAATLTKSDPELTVFASEFESARSRTATLGPRYPAVSVAVQGAIQASLTGIETPKAALDEAQSHIESIGQ
jgi:multiple sugar transport system substrate-binding protein